MATATKDKATKDNDKSEETKTKTRNVNTGQTKAQRDRMAAAKESAERRAAKQSEAEKVRKERADARKAEREQRKAEKDDKAREEQERLEKSGALITVPNEDGEGETRFVRVDRNGDEERKGLEQRAFDVIGILKETGREIPISGKWMQEAFGGGVVQYVAIFGVLKELNLVEAYRMSTGERGGSGVAYRWVGE